MFYPYATILLFITWRVYWRISEIKADKEKGKIKKKVEGVDLGERVSIIGLFILVIAQFLGFSIFPFTLSWAPSVGFLTVCVGFCVSSLARFTLGANWANSYEYQIKKNHELVIYGIYRYIRHPIYTGVFCMLIGAELVAQSYLIFLYLLILPGMYWQAKREEEILLQHFGKTYRAYMKLSKMFIPFVW
jgi:protein-S-isoprenylcysteine O-methyltransferase Ste14